jgi:hypothetical protein
VSVQQITSVSVLDAIRSGAHTRDALAAQFGVLSGSHTLHVVLSRLKTEGFVIDQDGRLTAHGEQLTIDEEIL